MMAVQGTQDLGGVILARADIEAEHQRRREAIWTVAVGSAAIDRLALIMSRRIGHIGAQVGRAASS